MRKLSTEIHGVGSSQVVVDNKRELFEHLSMLCLIQFLFEVHLCKYLSAVGGSR